MTVFFSIFLILGVVVLVIQIPKVVRAWEAQSWPQVDCFIASSAVRSETVQDKHGSHTVYLPQILFRYSFAGHRYLSSRYDLLRGSMSQGSAQDIIDSMPPRTKTVCYVNPLDSRDAVLSRSYLAGASAAILIPGIFALIGADGLLFALRSARSRHAKEITRHMAGGAEGPRQLKAVSSLVVRFMAEVIAVMIANGVTAILVCAAVAHWNHTEPAVLLVVIGVALVAVDLLLLYG